MSAATTADTASNVVERVDKLRHAHCVDLNAPLSTRLARLAEYRRRASGAQYLDVVLLDLRIACDEGQSLDAGLRDLDTVEGVLVVTR